jgi:hypothetical protein
MEILICDLPGLICRPITLACSPGGSPPRLGRHKYKDSNYLHYLRAGSPSVKKSSCSRRNFARIVSPNRADSNSSVDVCNLKERPFVASRQAQWWLASKVLGGRRPPTLDSLLRCWHAGARQAVPSLAVRGSRRLDRGVAGKRVRGAGAAGLAPDEVW